MLQTTIALILFLLPLAYSPGPGNLFFAANGARFGFGATIPASAGYHVATWIVTLAIGFGFSTALDQAPGVFVVLKCAGAAYVLWLAWTLVRAGVLRDAPAAKPARFVDGGVLLVLNPKAYVIIALMFTQFLDPSRAASPMVVLLIATVFTLNNLIAFSIWTLVGDQMAREFRTPTHAARLNLGFGVVLAGVAVWMLLS